LFITLVISILTKKEYQNNFCLFNEERNGNLYHVNFYLKKFLGKNQD